MTFTCCSLLSPKLRRGSYLRDDPPIGPTGARSWGRTTSIASNLSGRTEARLQAFRYGVKETEDADPRARTEAYPGASDPLATLSPFDSEAEACRARYRLEVLGTGNRGWEGSPSLDQLAAAHMFSRKKRQSVSGRLSRVIPQAIQDNEDGAGSGCRMRGGIISID